MAANFLGFHLFQGWNLLRFQPKAKGGLTSPPTLMGLGLSTAVPPAPLIERLDANCAAQYLSYPFQLDKCS